MAYIDVDKFAETICDFQAIDEDTANKMIWLLRTFPTADVAPKSEVVEEYRKKVYRKMEKYTVFGREYIQRIMREVEKEMVGDKNA